MSTIGYGVMHPVSTYAQAIVTIEAAVGILGVALITGLLFAKVSRPTSGILFSRPLIFNNFNGQPLLSFRVGNTRGNDIMDASVKLTVLVDHTSSEGQVIRRMHDLKLVRESSPFFALSWTVMHELNEESPMWDSKKNELISENIFAFSVVLIGHDGTYSQTIYKRHTYYPEDIRQNHQFVDVISSLSDGRLMVEYDKFHDTNELS